MKNLTKNNLKFSHSSLGIDIIENKRIKKAIHAKKNPEKFISKIFTPTEITYCQQKNDPTQHFAARFAAKESIAKALGCGIGKYLNFLDIEIKNNKNGKPEAKLSKKAYEKFPVKITISITHTKKYSAAIAQVY